MSIVLRVTHFALCAVVIGLLLGMVLHQPLAAQVTTGSISGVVTDTTGAIVAGADVAIKNLETNSNRAVKTNASGLYLASDLPVGRYEITVQAASFAPITKTGLTLTVGAASVQNFTLGVEPRSKW